MKRARGKKSTTLNLKSAEGRRIFLRMVANADVVVENFSVGVADRLGIGYEALRKANSRIIYCSLTGYGATGVDKNLKAYDLMVQAAVGLMSITGHPDRPPTKAGSPLSDAIAGVFAAMGVLSALLHRERTGEGQSVDVSMADCLFSLIFDEPLDCYSRLGLGFQQGSRIMRFSPFNAYKSADGWITIGAATDDDWVALLDVMGQSRLKDNAQMMSIGWRLANNASIDAIVTEWTTGMANADIVAQLSAAKVPCSPVRTIDEVLQWQQMRDRGMATPLYNPLSKTDMPVFAPGFPVKFGASPAGYDTPAPLPGQHSAEVLDRLAQLTPSDIASLRASGVV